MKIQGVSMAAAKALLRTLSNARPCAKALARMAKAAADFATRPINRLILLLPERYVLGPRCRAHLHQNSKWHGQVMDIRLRFGGGRPVTYMDVDGYELAVGSKNVGGRNPGDEPERLLWPIRMRNEDELLAVLSLMSCSWSVQGPLPRLMLEFWEYGSAPEESIEVSVTRSPL